MLKAFVRLILRLFYRIEIHGLKHYREADGPVLVVANHQSFLDPVILWAFLPGDLTFAINTHIARLPWVRPFLRFARVFSLDPRQSGALKSLIRHLQAGHRTVIFPEGRITVTGTLMKVYDGPGMVADRANALIVPVRIDGAQYTPFSRLDSSVRKRWFPRIRVCILPPRDIRPPEEVRGGERRKLAGERLAALMAEMMLVTTPDDRTLFAALLDAARLYGLRRRILEDGERRPLRYFDLIARSLIMAALIEEDGEPDSAVGILLPSSAATVGLLFGCHLARRLPALLNYTAGMAGLTGACDTGSIGTVVTSRRFVAAAGLEDAVASLVRRGIRIHYLEDWRSRISLPMRVRAALSALGIHWRYRVSRDEPGNPAVMLFTSGSEGRPKAVLLSHRNLLSNCAQMGAVIDFNANDVILNVLPLFHVFGLGPGTILPLISGMRLFLYPNPLHYRVIPELAYEINATVLFGTNTFLGGYGRSAHPYDFYSVRYVFAGAEKLQPDVRQLWMDKFGLRILEGYGATETSPVLAVNTPMYYRAGTVGRFLPGIEWRLEPVPGVGEGGRLHVRGPNVMLGYLLPGRPGERVAPKSRYGEGWYDTGDIVRVDDTGFVTIVGRLKRFAKVGGEMVPLSALESLAAELWPEHRHAAVAVAEGRRGETVILVSECPEASLAALQAAARRQGMPELWWPKRIVHRSPLPLLGSGKVDYQALSRFLADH